MTFTLERDGYRLSDDATLLDEDTIFASLKRSYWAQSREPNTQRIANRNSLCFGVYREEKQIGFARVVTDYATFAYLADVYIDDAHQGHGLGKWLVQSIHAHPRLQGLRRWTLATRDAHGLYAQFGWKPLANPHRWMERYDGDANPPQANAA
jgi:GNAT superfamily N-acetyltransferase